MDNFEDVGALVNHPSQRGLDRLEDQESKQLTTVMYDTEKDVYGVGSIDQQAPEHVQCCGHQVLEHAYGDGRCIVCPGSQAHLWMLEYTCIACSGAKKFVHS